MTPRSIRRAAERKAVKQARKATQIPNPIVTPAQQAANESNAQLSTGPKTETGKQISSHNALKTGLTGETVLLPTDDMDAYKSLIATLTDKLDPATPEERELVQSIADTKWRLRRIVPLEFAIYAKGALEFADHFEDLEPAARAQMIQVETYLKYEKSLRNLNTQEGRLQRRLAKDTTELQRLQSERRQQEAEVASFLAKQAAKPVPPIQTAPLHPALPEPIWVRICKSGTGRRPDYPGTVQSCLTRGFYHARITRLLN